jgi:FtsZ-binding cell division protein ZapB
LTDAQQWDQDWTTYAGQQHYFADSGRPAGTPRQRYDVLCPLYKGHGIPRPMVYLSTSITTAKFYHFSTPAHTNLATALSTAEGKLKGKGYASAPVKSVWALNPRTTSAGGWSNHADGKAVDLDPDDNPHLVDQQERKIITLDTGTNIDKGGQGYNVMKGASDKFKADYNPAGLQRRVTEFKADEKTKETARNTAKSERDTLKSERDTLKTERDALNKDLRSLPKGKKATTADVDKAAELKAGIQQKDAGLKQVQTEIKQKEGDLKKKEAELKTATKDRELIEKQLATYQATEQAIADLENAVKALPDEIKSLEDQITQSKQDETEAKAVKNAAGVQAQQKLRAKLQQAITLKKAALKKQQTQLDKKKKARDADTLRKYAAGGFVNLPKDVVDEMTGAGLTWGGDWEGAKDFMHFEL